MCERNYIEVYPYPKHRTGYATPSRLGFKIESMSKDFCAMD